MKCRYVDNIIYFLFVPIKLLNLDIFCPFFPYTQRTPFKSGYIFHSASSLNQCYLRPKPVQKCQIVELFYNLNVTEKNAKLENQSTLLKTENCTF